MHWYLSAWLVACLVVVVLAHRERTRIELLQRRYWQFLLRGWKLATFAVAASFLTLVAPYSNDPTWDYVDALVMSILAFTTAPWVVGTLYRSRHGPWPLVFIALGVWLFSASWFYDLYILSRDGRYPVTWLENMFFSSLLYIAAGLFWNLEWNAARGARFQFQDRHWPKPDPETRFLRIAGYALPFMLCVVFVIAPFLV